LAGCVKQPMGDPFIVHGFKEAKKAPLLAKPFDVTLINNRQDSPRYLSISERKKGLRSVPFIERMPREPD